MFQLVKCGLTDVILSLCVFVFIKFLVLFTVKFMLSYLDKFSVQSPTKLFFFITLSSILLNIYVPIYEKNSFLLWLLVYLF